MFQHYEQQGQVVWAGQLPGYEHSDVPITVAGFLGEIPAAVKQQFGSDIPATATPMTNHIPSEVLDLSGRPSGEFFDVPQASVATAGQSTSCNIFEDHLDCRTPTAAWPIDLPAPTNVHNVTETGYNSLSPYSGATLMSGPPPDLSFRSGPLGSPESELQHGEARYFNNFICMAANNDFACWEALQGNSFIIADGQYQPF